MKAHKIVEELKTEVSRSIIGQERVVERLLLTLLCNGNLLLEGLPGLAKTRAIKSLADNLAADFRRVQFTPDLLPSDVTGTEVLHTASDGKQTLQFQPGPLFANLVLADEINRAPAKVQSALLEAMEERQVTVAGKTHPMPELFMVLATQNPIEQEGTYPLPEAQVDRFLMKVMVDYPPAEQEANIVRLVRGEELGEGKRMRSDERPIIEQEVVFDARREVHGIHVSAAVEQYIVDLITATRRPERLEGDLKSWIEVGASPRGTLALDKAGRAYAWLRGRDHVLPDDVQAIVHDVLRHRLILSYEANAEGVSAEKVIDEVLNQVAVA